MYDYSKKVVKVLLDVELGFKKAFIVLICFVSPACANEEGYGKLPLTAPFELQKLNTQLGLTFKVTKEDNYSFNLRFQSNNANPDQADRLKLEALMGDRHAGSNEKLSKGAPIAISLKVINIDDDGEHIVADMATQYLAIYSWGWGGFDKEIYRLSLLPGKYKVTITTLKDMPEFGATRTEFRVGRAYTGK